MAEMIHNVWVVSHPLRSTGVSLRFAVHKEVYRIVDGAGRYHLAGIHKEDLVRILDREPSITTTIVKFS